MSWEWIYVTQTGDSTPHLPMDEFILCPEGGLTNDQGTSQMTWEWICPTQRGGSTPHLPVDVFTLCPEGGLTNVQSTKQRRRNRSL